MPQLSHITSVSVASLGRLPLQDKAGTFTPSARKRDHKPGLTARDGGFATTTTPASLDLKVNLLGLTMDQLDFEGQMVIVKLAGGETHMLPDAFTEEAVPNDDGTASLKIKANESERT